MSDPGLLDYRSATQAIRHLADGVLAVAPNIELVFVTNVRETNWTRPESKGLAKEAQYYTRDEADRIIRAYQELGVTVRPFFDERDFLIWALEWRQRSGHRQPVVFNTAECGMGSGQRALIPAVCGLLGLATVRSGPHASSLSRHKFHANAVLAQLGVRVPASWMLRNGNWAGARRPPLGTRVILKPMYESMCIGIDETSVTIVDEDFHAFACDREQGFQQALLAQEFITGEEVGVPVLRMDHTYTLPAVAFRRADGSPYGQHPKTFEDENVTHDVSRALYTVPTAVAHALHEAAALAFDALELRGAGRMDFRVDADGRAWLFDTSEAPPPLSPTAYSLAMEELGFSYQEMLAVWLAVALKEHRIL